MNKRQKEVQQSMLQEEQEYIRRLKETYRQASRDCENKIRELSARSDLENIQSIVYQKQYQQILKMQIDEALMDLQSNEYRSMNEYLENCYINGAVGAFYDMHGQGVPVLFPIDQSQVAKAVKLDSKISVGLYTRLGEDVLKLKENIRNEVSRGIANGSTWNQTASNLAMGMRSPLNKSYNNAVRIARTEGHRIQNQAQMDTLNKAKSKGADVVKQWDSTLDDDTRDTHKQLDGQIREIDQPFEVNGKTAMQPGGFGDPAEDCNCRCCMLQRAKWALDESELRELESRAEYFGLDKAESFEDFKKKYLNIPENDDIIKLDDIQIFRTLSARAKNYDVLDPQTGEYFKFVEGTRIQNSQVFAGKGCKKPLNDEVAKGLSEQIGGTPEKWQHAKGNGVIDYFGEERKAEVHWFQEETVGKHKFKVKRWLDDED